MKLISFEKSQPSDNGVLRFKVFENKQESKNNHSKECRHPFCKEDIFIDCGKISSFVRLKCQSGHSYSYFPKNYLWTRI